ncbi:hypothetical protein AVEN_254003-1 [Araneus ventricosus]|uniref:Transposable element Tc1 transposase n=1 Tax=Araneus ventricosus TaxID=182803 RepID=A0A4Y2E9P8_ARAVE|nr:hypothetical protein AVEN_254003-1 [Araneus ventricosus]
MDEWKRVAWSDESRFLIHHVDGRVRVRRLPGEQLFTPCTAGHTQAGGGGIIFWVDMRNYKRKTDRGTTPPFREAAKEVMTGCSLIQPASEYGINLVVFQRLSNNMKTAIDGKLKI